MNTHTFLEHCRRLQFQDYSSKPYRSYLQNTWERLYINLPFPKDASEEHVKIYIAYEFEKIGGNKSPRFLSNYSASRFIFSDFKEAQRRFKKSDSEFMLWVPTPKVIDVKPTKLKKESQEMAQMTEQEIEQKFKSEVPKTPNGVIRRLILEGGKSEQEILTVIQKKYTDKKWKVSDIFWVVRQLSKRLGREIKISGAKHPHASKSPSKLSGRPSPKRSDLKPSKKSFTIIKAPKEVKEPAPALTSLTALTASK